MDEVVQNDFLFGDWEVFAWHPVVFQTGDNILVSDCENKLGKEEFDFIEFVANIDFVVDFGVVVDLLVLVLLVVNDRASIFKVLSRKILEILSVLDFFCLFEGVDIDPADRLLINGLVLV